MSLSLKTSIISFKTSISLPIVKYLTACRILISHFLLSFFWNVPLIAVALWARMPEVVYLLFGASVTFYVLSHLHYAYQQEFKGGQQIPPMVPYAVPFFGHTLSVLLNPTASQKSILSVLRSSDVYGLKVAGLRFFFVDGPANIAVLRKHPRALPARELSHLFMRMVFGQSEEALRAFTHDTSGHVRLPTAGSQVEAYNRIIYMQHDNFRRNLHGAGLSTLASKFAESMDRRLSSLDSSGRWISYRDLSQLWLPFLTAAVVEAIAGPRIEEIDPCFSHKLIELHDHMPMMMKGTARVFAPRIYRVRDDVVGTMKKWGRATLTEAQSLSVEESTNLWGSKLMNERQRMLEVDGWNEQSLAIGNAALLHGATLNSNNITIWALIEVFKDECLLSRVRQVLDIRGYTGTMTMQDASKIIREPLLLSIMHEVLRLYVSIAVVITNPSETIDINKWLIPPRSYIITATDPAHQDEQSWHTQNGEFPLNTFWSDRFLRSDADSKSGPLRFDESRVRNSFFPFSFGITKCPGRTFVHFEIVSFMAYVVHNFDIKLVAAPAALRPDPEHHMFGADKPLGPVSFQMRRRKAS